VYDPELAEQLTDLPAPAAADPATAEIEVTLPTG
jgi:hypothetical protein